MTAINIMLVVGARPQFIKSAPIIKELMAEKKRFMLTLVHSGQHYDPEMSAVFFRELRIPEPSVQLKAGSGSHAAQTATIIKRLEKPMLNRKPNVVLVPGDTNTTLAGALTAAKLGISVGHIEAGLRSGDLSMAEEVNRRLADHCATFLFAPTRTAVRNLAAEGLADSTYLTGDTMVDAMRTVMPLIGRRQKSVLEKLKLESRDYVLVTLHRPSNVDNAPRLNQIHSALQKIARRVRVVFPVHPRTQRRLSTAKLSGSSGKVTFTEPQGYIETLSLLSNAACLVTDSGGMQKESFLLHVPCITIRATTEWPETLKAGANQLVIDPRRIPAFALERAADDDLRKRLRRLKNPFGDGHASRRITRILARAPRPQIAGN